MRGIGNFGPTITHSKTYDKYSPAQSRGEESTNSIEDRVELTSARAQEIESGLGDRVPGQVLVKVSSDLNSEQLKDLAESQGAVLKQEVRIPDSMKEAFGGKLIVLETGPGLTESQTMALLETNEHVLSFGANDRMELIDSREGSSSAGVAQDEQPPKEPTEKLPNDIHPEQWNIRNRNFPGGIDGADIQAGKAWKITTGKGAKEGGPIIAVVDSGIDAFHEDLKANMWKNPNEERNGEDDNWDGFTDDIHGIDASTGTGNIVDEVGHGTHVAGVIGAVSDNGKGVAGINWDTQLMGVKIADSNRVNLLAAITGVLYAAENGARIANHSWGGRINNPILHDVMASSPTLHVCAAGNAQKDADVEPSFPAAYDLPNVISVAASTRRESHVFFSNWGKESVDLHAPGAIIHSTIPMNSYKEMSGTSMAAPHVTGVAGLIASKYPDATNQQIKDRIIYGADKIEAFRHQSVSGGRLNAHSALENDKVAPAVVKDMKMTNLTSDGFELEWTGVGDDGMKGVLSAYDIWADYGDERARLVPEFPKGPGAKETATFRTIPLGEDRPLSVTLTPIDNVGNRPKSSVLSTVLPEAAVPLFDDFEGETTNWTAEGTWARVEEKGRGKVFTDSPDGNYKDSDDTGIISPKFDLTDMRSATLSFDAKLISEKFDFIWVESTKDGGDSYDFMEVIRPSENQDWQKYKMDLSHMDGEKNVQLRFHLRTSNDKNNDGAYLDNIKVESAKIGKRSA